jgi:hypothetical protein
MSTFNYEHDVYVTWLMQQQAKYKTCRLDRTITSNQQDSDCQLTIRYRALPQYEGTATDIDINYLYLLEQSSVLTLYINNYELRQ